jgi:hypothetical protein
MTLKDKIITLSSLGKLLRSAEFTEKKSGWASRAKNENGWFTEDNVFLALDHISSHYLDEDLLVNYSSDMQPDVRKTVGVVAAGNIPLVGFHDLLSVVLSGHKALLKLSTSDSVLMKLMIDRLININPEIAQYITIADRLNSADAFIATGSDNSSRYFQHYFGTKPHIIRQNRSSVAILNGEESDRELRDLGNDIFFYFGLGCRNVSKLFVPEGYSFTRFFEAIEYWNTIHIHHKYSNNYDYNKSIYLVNGDTHLDNGFLLLKEDSNLVSPLGAVFYETYRDEADLNNKLEINSTKLQCIVGKDNIPFGQSQFPELNDFADGVNTMKFLATI